MALCLEFAFKVKLSDRKDMEALVASLFLKTPVLYSLHILMALLKDGISLNKDHNLKMLAHILSQLKMFILFV
jgi:hypothetical protein